MTSRHRPQPFVLVFPLLLLVLVLLSGPSLAQPAGPAFTGPSGSAGPEFHSPGIQPACLPLGEAESRSSHAGGPTADDAATLLPSATKAPQRSFDSVQPVNFQVGQGNALDISNGFRVGSISVVPYGRLWADMIYSDSRTSPGDFILWIDSPDDQGEETFVIDARRSRIGMDLTGPELDFFGGINGGGKVEIDFYGTFPNQNKTNVRLRHVYWEAKNEDLRMLVGQTWDLTSPLLPNTVNFAVGWAVGNIGFRRTQFRLERYLHLSDDVTLSLQGALAQNIVPDLANVSGVTRETGDWPMLQARTALTFPGLWRQPWTIGWSGHIGDTGFDFKDPGPPPANLPPEDDDARFRSWSVNADANMPITDRFGIHGEFFTGQDLHNLVGGIAQGIGPISRTPIKSTGGWGEIWYDWTPAITSNIGVGVDDPNNNDFLEGRTYNRVIYSNVWVQLTNDLRTGFEVSNWRTSYQTKTPGKATTLDWTVMYRF